MPGTGQESSEIETEIESLENDRDAADTEEEKADIQESIDDKEDQLSEQDSYEAGLADMKELIDENGGDDEVLVPA
jgi:hypothetical protein